MLTRTALLIVILAILGLVIIQQSKGNRLVWSSTIVDENYWFENLANAWGGREWGGGGWGGGGRREWGGRGGGWRGGREWRGR